MSEGRCTSVPLHHTGKEVTYNALVLAFFAPELDKTQYQHLPTCLSEHNSTLFLMTHDTRTIGKIAVYDMAINLLFGKSRTRGCVLLISCMTAQKSEFSIFLGIIVSAFK